MSGRSASRLTRSPNVTQRPQTCVPTQSVGTRGASVPRLRFGLVCVLTGLGGVYYALFACFFLMVAGTVRAGVRAPAHAPAGGRALAGLIFGSLLVTLAPSLHYRQTHGVNPERGRRSPCEAEIYGLKISQMTLPVVGHRVSEASAKSLPITRRRRRWSTKT